MTEVASVRARHTKRLRAQMVGLFLVAATLFSFAAAQPEPAVTASSAGDLLGSTVTLTASFDNASAAPADVGYGPYLDVILPTSPEPLAYAGATYLGQPLTQQIVEFDADGFAVHPFAVDGSGAPIVISGPPNGFLVVLTLPFGSVTIEQPSIDVDISLTISEEAAVGTPVELDVVPGFRYGANPLDDPLNDEPLRGPSITGEVTPEIARFSKTLVAPEGDTNVGDSFTYSYVMELELAPGQTFNDIVIEDVLPNALVIRGGTLAVTMDGDPIGHTSAFTFTDQGSNGGPLVPNFPADQTGPYAQSSFQVALANPVETPRAAPVPSVFRSTSSSPR